MAIIPQQQLFGWREIKELGDLKRLVLLIENLPDEELMRTLERERGKGRNDYPVRALWNSVLAMIVYQHSSIESLRRELRRNAQLREVCGFPVGRGERGVPPPWVYTRFLRSLYKHHDKVRKIFRLLRGILGVELPDFGKILAIDGKAIASYAKGRKQGEGKELAADERRDTDADWGCKTYKGKREDGSEWQEKVFWFGYRLHLIVDAKYELPVEFEVTRASTSEVKEAWSLLEKLEKESPRILKGCRYFLGDRGYDDGKLITKLYERHNIKPVVDIRNCWRDGEETKLVTGHKNVVYNYKGEVFCHCPRTDKRRQMAYGGFEEKRKALKYRCPAKHYGLECRGIAECPVRGSVRIPLKEDRRIFTPVARSSYRWKNLYKKRTAVERVNSRLDVVFGFEYHYIRGLKKMELRCGLALIVMLGMALGWIREKKAKNLRSVVKVA